MYPEYSPLSDISFVNIFPILCLLFSVSLLFLLNKFLISMMSNLSIRSYTDHASASIQDVVT